MTATTNAHTPPTIEIPGLPVIDSRFTRELPADPDPENHRRQVHAAAFSRVLPTPVAAPRTLAWSREVAELLELPAGFCDSQAFADVMAGNALLPGMDPYAMCYGGHQFGNWAGQLGDGRAINLGEIENRHGERWTLQLKGAGPTPYSRTADGRAVLRSSLREYLCSEAMHHLGVPTTRALSLVTTGDQVVRDMFYDGRPAAEPGAIVCRVAPSFVRIGNFELAASRNDIGLLRALLDYVIRNDFPELGESTPETWIAWYREVCERTMAMVVDWQRVGFVHGVMNTDNLSVLGLTIDYGPYGWVDDFDPDWTPNTTDAQGRRYRFGQQPQVAVWNLMQLGRALVPLLERTEPIQAVLDRMIANLDGQMQTMMAGKLGLGELRDGDVDLVNALLDLLRAEETDMTIFHRQLAAVDADGVARGAIEGAAALQPLLPAFYSATGPSAAHGQALIEWLGRWSRRVATGARPASERKAAMNAMNPRYVLRNYMAQLAIDAAEQGDARVLNELHELLRNPYEDQPGQERWAERRPDWARTRAGCSMLSCSS